MKTIPTADEVRAEAPQDPSSALRMFRRVRELRHLAMGELLEKAESEKRDLLASEDREFRKHQTELRKLDLAIDEIESREREVAEGRARFHKLMSVNVNRGVHLSETQEQLRCLARGEVRHVDIDPAESGARMGTFDASSERRDLSVGSATAGGNTVPTGFYNRLVEHAIETSGIRQTNVTVVRTAGGEDLQIPKTTTHPTASIVAEAGTIGESDPAFGQVTLGAYKYAFLTQTTYELSQDTNVDLEGYLARAAARAISNGFGAHTITGTGSGQPNGVVTAATVGKTGGTGNSGIPQADELIDLFFSVIPEYRNRGTWLMSDATFAEVRKLKDSNNNYLVGPLTDGGGLTLLGRPVVIDPNVADAALSAKSVVFGDLSGYFIREAGPIRIQASEDYAYNQDLVTWRFIWRLDGDLVDTSAVKVFQAAAS